MSMVLRKTSYNRLKKKKGSKSRQENKGQIWSSHCPLNLCHEVRHFYKTWATNSTQLPAANAKREVWPESAEDKGPPGEAHGRYDGAEGGFSIVHHHEPWTACSQASPLWNPACQQLTVSLGATGNNIPQEDGHRGSTASSWERFRFHQSSGPSLPPARPCFHFCIRLA